MRNLENVVRSFRAGGAAVAERASSLRPWWVPVSAAGLTAFAMIAVFRMESTTPNYDPQYMRVLVERTMRFGGSYYSNGVHNKGPLEPLVHEIAGRLGGAAGWWFIMAAFALVAAMLVGLAAGIVVVRSGGPTVLAATAASVAVVHLTLTDADYAGVLYARNITTALICAAVGMAAFDPFWATERRRRISVLVVGAAIGLAAQTLLTAAFTSGPMLVWAMWERRHCRVGGRSVRWVLPTVAACAFFSAPVYYRLVGPWQDFVDGYWIHARFMSSGTGRGLGSQVGLGWDRIVEYHRERPAILVVLVAFAIAAVVSRREPRRATLHLAIAVWWLGGWVEMVLSQRYSSHYYSVVAVPTLMMIAAVVGVVGCRMRFRSPAWALLPLVAAYGTIEAGGRTGFDQGLTTTAEVGSTTDFVARREAGIDGRTMMLRATLDLVSDAQDPLLVWTSYPWPYLNLERTSATRYIWKTFLMGEIYLGGSGPEFVVPGTWEHFADDLERTDPTAYFVESVDPIDPSTPFRREVDDRFTDVYTDEAVTFGLRDDLAAWMRMVPEDGKELGPAADETFELARCHRLDGRIAAGAGVPLVVETVRSDGAPTSVDVVAVSDGFEIGSRPFGRPGWVTTLEVAIAEVPVTVIVGDESVVVFVDGRLAGAVEMAPGAPVRVTSGMADLTRRGAQVSSTEVLDGC
jgi:hypothetical protein